MATLNLSTNGPSISKTYQSIIDAPLPTAESSTYGQWALYSVSAPLANAFKPESATSESVLKVETTGAGELTDLIEEFSDGRIQFGFVKVKDPNTTLAKYVLIGWCGEGVPERTKGYFTSHLAAASKVLRGYHVQITARSDRDLTAEGIIQKVADSSGSKYSAAAPSTSTGPPPPLASKPVFNPTRTGGGGGGSSFNPLAASRSQPTQPQGGNVDSDGWGDDAPPVTRTQLEKVQSAYQPTKVNMSELTKRREEPSRFTSQDNRDENPDVVRGAYQPVGKVDIAAIRRQAQASGSTGDERPTTVKGAYEPVGKVDIAAIRARAQPPSGGGTGVVSGLSPAATGNSGVSQDSTERPASLADRSSAFSQSERLTSLPKPKVGNKFGSSSSTFTGTKPPAPTGFGLDSKPAQAPPVGTASRTFADEGGKTPAQIWAEKKARERGMSGTGDNAPAIGATPIASQNSGGEEWKSGYSGKSWAPVSTGRSGGSGGVEQQRTGDEPLREEDASASPAGGVSAIRDSFKGAAPMGAAAVPSSFTGDRSNPSPPPLATASKPNAGPGARAIPGIAPVPAFQEEDDHRMPTPPAVPRSPTPPTPPSMRPSSPIRVVMPVGRGHGEAPMSPPEERFSPPPVPTEAISAAVPHARDLTDEPSGHDPARGAGIAAAAASFPSSTPSGGAGHGPRALVQYEYEKAEDNEIDLVEGQYVHNIDMVDDDWWMVTNEKGESGLVPANYLELVHEEETPAHAEPAHTHSPAAPAAAAAPAATKAGSTATAIYDYEAAEDNELSFPEGATITDIEFPDEDWWMGSYKGKQALFPGSYVELHK